MRKREQLLYAMKKITVTDSQNNLVWKGPPVDHLVQPCAQAELAGVRLPRTVSNWVLNFSTNSLGSLLQCLVNHSQSENVRIFLQVWISFLLTSTQSSESRCRQR